MGTSNWQNISYCVGVLRRLKPASVLDVGTGFGRWGVLCREFLDVWEGREARSLWQTRIEGILEDARQQAQRSLAQANQAGEQLRAQIEQQAQERARDILAQAEKNTQQAVAQAKAELRSEVADLAILAAERVVGKSMDTATNRQLVQEFVAQSKELQC